MIVLRNVSQPERYPKVHMLSSFVYSALRDDEGKEDKGYERVKRMTRSRREVPDIFACKYVLIPIHLGQHWCCAVINFHRRRIEYYDSLLSIHHAAPG